MIYHGGLNTPWLAIDKDNNCYALEARDAYQYSAPQNILFGKRGEKQYLIMVMMPQPIVNIAMIILAKEAIKQYVNKPETEIGEVEETEDIPF